MGNTSVHFPEGLIEELDRLAAERGVSRNSLIIESCRHMVSRRIQWPDGFFSNAHLSADDLAELERSADEFETEIMKARRSRASRPF